MTVLLWVNAVLGLASAAFGVAALVAPERLAGAHQSSLYFAWMYAARAIPFGVAVGLVAALQLPGLPVWLFAAGAIQAADAAVGTRRGRPGAIVAPAIAAGIHLVTAGLLVAS